VSENTKRFEAGDAERLVREHWGFVATARELPGYDDANFHLRDERGAEFVFKLAAPGESLARLELQHRALARIGERDPALRVPRPRATAGGTEIVVVEGAGAAPRLARVLEWLPGRLIANLRPFEPQLLDSLGRFLARLDLALEGLVVPRIERDLPWDLARAGSLRRHLGWIGERSRRDLVERLFLLFDARVAPVLAGLPRSAIHNDANDYNLLAGAAGDPGVVDGIIDFGDLIEAPTVCELAIACAYAILDAPDPLAAAAEVTHGYHGARALSAHEIDVLYPLICARLCSSVLLSARGAGLDPHNAYVRVTEGPAWAMLERLAEIAPDAATSALRRTCGLPRAAPASPATGDVAARRKRHLGPSLRLSYVEPLHIVEGRGQHLFDAGGRPYLDLVNNVCHVGHAHPRVVEAAARQMARLNTNTRYLHETLASYAERLAALLPDPLEVCYFVCSGSEANELALRLARAATGGSDVVAVDAAYHGNTGALIEISAYKFAGPGGAGAAPHVRVAPLPDVYRGPYREDDAHAARRYADHVGEAFAAIRAAGRRPAAFVCESLPGCGGQIVPPAGYLTAAFRHARAAGALCIADEVQVGFGRVGRTFWGFELDGVVPDIVTLGKPMGNGHPLGAVVTTRAVAEAFDNGMEYFNTFGGNPVSCAAGLAVLDVIEEQGLQRHALEIGERFLAGLRETAQRRAPIGDVRGAGLFLGVELVEDRERRTPAPALAARVAEGMRHRGVLISTDGPQRNVLKIKPPLVLSEEDAELAVRDLERTLEENGVP